MVDLAQMVKDAVKIPVIAIGKLGDPTFAEGVLKEGKADFIALGRPLLSGLTMTGPSGSEACRRRRRGSGRRWSRCRRSRGHSLGNYT